MKYWSYLVAKSLIAIAILSVLERAIARAFPPDPAFLDGRQNPVMRYLGYISCMLVFWLIASGFGWLIMWDQKYRCRVCLRRLRMPIQKGSWNHVLLGAPRTEYICLYGHGTLNVAGLQITGRQSADWLPHDDMWKELFSLEEDLKK
jgi:hypothetical protein